MGASITVPYTPDTDAVTLVKFTLCKNSKKLCDLKFYVEGATRPSQDNTEPFSAEENALLDEEEKAPKYSGDIKMRINKNVTGLRWVTCFSDDQAVEDQPAPIDGKLPIQKLANTLRMEDLLGDFEPQKKFYQIHLPSFELPPGFTSNNKSWSIWAYMVDGNDRVHLRSCMRVSISERMQQPPLPPASPQKPTGPRLVTRHDSNYDVVSLNSADGDQPDERATTIDEVPPTEQQPASEPPPGPVSCKCQDHYSIGFLDTTFNMSLKKMYETLFSSNPAELMALYQSLNYKDISMKPWKPDGTRETNFTLPLNAPIGPKQAKAMNKESIDWKENNQCFSVEIVAQTPDVPYGECFTTCTRYCVMAASGSAVRVVITGEVKFVKSTIMRAMIARS
eukprot:Colp12_sorted_trinity150504_noHs@13117